MPGTSVFLNGKFFGGDAAHAAPSIAEARVSAFDAGVQHAVGLFETMRAGVLRRGIEGPTTHGEEVETWVLFLAEHMGRLTESARVLGLSDQLRGPGLEQAILETVRRSGLERARVRLTITGGDLSLLAAAQSGGAPRQADPTILIVAQPATDYPDAMFERGVPVSLATTRANPLDPTQGHKTLDYWWRLRELQIAAGKSAAEAVVLSITNHLVGGCVSNVLLVKGDTLLTPIARGEEQRVAGPDSKPIPSPVLPGVTRAWALETAVRLGLEVKRQMLSVQDMLGADEVLLTNASWGVLPVVRVEANAIGRPDAGAGRMARSLRDAWLGAHPTVYDTL